MPRPFIAKAYDHLAKPQHRIYRNQSPFGYSRAVLLGCALGMFAVVVYIIATL